LYYGEVLRFERLGCTFASGAGWKRNSGRYVYPSGWQKMTANIRLALEKGGTEP